MSAWKWPLDTWRTLKSAAPGRRFQQRYAAMQKNRGRQNVVWRIARVLIGVAAIAIGLVEIVFPGPAVLFFLVGGALLAGESLMVARALDRTELRGRHAIRGARRLWRRASWQIRSAFVLLIAALTAAGSWFAVQVMVD